MTLEQKRIKIAEACGWTSIATDYPVNINDGNYYVPWPSGRSPGKKYLQLPDYFNDLNKMHEAENVLTLEQQITFQDSLIALHNFGQGTPVGFAFRVTHSTAAQRAEAFGKTLNLW